MQNEIIKKFKVHIVFIIILVGLTIFNFLKYKNKNTTFSQSIYNKIYSLTASQTLDGSTFPITKIQETITGEIKLTQFDSLTLVILLSNQGCHPCQLRELINIKKFLQYGSINALAIYSNNYNEKEALGLKKMSRITFPIFYSLSDQINDFNFTNNYPIILIIEKQRIISSLVAIPLDDNYSQNYFSILRKKIY